jgi:RNA polymerase sigma-70 factor (ECF subfamily)
MVERLRVGDAGAAEQAFRTYEPLLRAMVRRRLTPPLRAKFDSTDVVQSVWAGVLAGFRAAEWQFQDEEHLRAFLVRVTYYHFVKYCRRLGPAVEREQRMDGEEYPRLPPSDQPRPSQVAQADELWMMLWNLCPPAHRKILDLKRQGVPLAEIAKRTGLHESSVRRVLYTLAKRLANARTRAQGA